MEKWIIICNPLKYDVEAAFNTFKIIEWKQSTNVQVGDLVYIYVGKYVGKIKYLCKVNKVNLSEIINDDTRFTIDGSGFMNHGRYMQLELINSFDEDLLSYRYLKENGLGSVQGPSRMDEKIEKYISSVIKRIEIPYDKDLFLETIRDYIKSWCEERAKNKDIFFQNDFCTGKTYVRFSTQVLDAILPPKNTILGSWNNGHSILYEIENREDKLVVGCEMSTKGLNKTEKLICNKIIEKFDKTKTKDDWEFCRVTNWPVFEHSNKHLIGIEIKNAIYNSLNSVLKNQIEIFEKQLISIGTKEAKILDQKYIEQEQMEDESLLLEVQNTLYEKTEFNYTGIPKKKQIPIEKNGYLSFPRDKQISINGLVCAGFKCEINEAHESFVRKTTGKRYMEPHHLIPLAYSEQFDYSLDVEENIVSLCSNCHNQLHYGSEIDGLLSKLYKDRKDMLLSVGINISYENLKAMYF